MFKGTINDFAATIGENYQTTVGLVRFLTSQGVATKTGEKRAANGVNGRGKPSDIYAIPLTVNLTFKEPTPVLDKVLNQEPNHSVLLDQILTEAMTETVVPETVVPEVLTETVVETPTVQAV